MTPVVVAMTGASGAIYGARLLQVLLAKGTYVHCVMSDSGKQVLKQELKIDLSDLPTDDSHDSQLFLQRLTEHEWLDTPERQAAGQWAGERLQLFDNDDFLAPMASGSHLTAGMVVCPCSGSTLSGIACGRSGNLIQRAAEVHLKERRKLLLVTRETPLSQVNLQNQLQVTQAGGVILPASPGWYHGVGQLLDLVDFVVARILDQLGQHHDLMRRWGGSDQ